MKEIFPKMPKTSHDPVDVTIMELTVSLVVFKSMFENMLSGWRLVLVTMWMR